MVLQRASCGRGGEERGGCAQELGFVTPADWRELEKQPYSPMGMEVRYV